MIVIELIRDNTQLHGDIKGDLFLKWLWYDKGFIRTRRVKVLIGSNLQRAYIISYTTTPPKQEKL